jgi:hypothetical protein
MVKFHLKKYILAPILCPEKIETPEMKQISDEIERLDVIFDRHIRTVDINRNLLYNQIIPLEKKYKELDFIVNKKCYEYWGVKNE